jgi:hypothetical protein
VKRSRNVTITVDDEVARWARIKAAEESTSVSRLLGGVLRQMMRQHQRFDSARREFQRLDAAIISDGAYPRREDLHDRTGVR